MKIVLVAGIGLLVGLGGGTMVSAFRVKAEILEKREEARADSLAALDAAGSHGPDGGVTVVLPPEATAVHGDSTAVEAPPAEASREEVAQDAAPVPQAPDSSAPPVEATTSGDGAPGADAPAVQEAAPAPEKEVLNTDGARKLSRIFGAMKPADAAAVLVRMGDDEVTAVLLPMSERQAGPILGAFPADRAAKLGSALLRARGGGA